MLLFGGSSPRPLPCFDCKTSASCQERGRRCSRWCDSPAPHLRHHRQPQGRQSSSPPPHLPSLAFVASCSAADGMRGRELQAVTSSPPLHLLHRSSLHASSQSLSFVLSLSLLRTAQGQASVHRKRSLLIETFTSRGNVHLSLDMFTSHRHVHFSYKLSLLVKTFTSHRMFTSHSLYHLLCCNT